MKKKYKTKRRKGVTTYESPWQKRVTRFGTCTLITHYRDILVVPTNMKVRVTTT